MRFECLIESVQISQHCDVTHTPCLPAHNIVKK
jgi:hypothetical protein